MLRVYQERGRHYATRQAEAIPRTSQSEQSGVSRMAGRGGPSPDLLDRVTSPEALMARIMFIRTLASSSGTWLAKTSSQSCTPAPSFRPSSILPRTRGQVARPTEPHNLTWVVKL